ncbi:hypothetical protein ASG31_02930 [Chryseobacterium sp. Leaf404]|uniref:hypothetical protein n=1 Tax=unclassified Chryseobacterium TaxID=2593645 RepID=UPI0006F557F4|nr:MULTISPECIES: hypothetical protein [unclassified Chryseobacterium]KQT22306.1 hypothetical protein ASG31_02930 [Chryseobacterium sp. Leaf404]
MTKFIFLLLPFLAFSQKTEIIDLSKSIKGNKANYKSFTVLDKRSNPEIGSVMYHKDQVYMVFENNAETDFKNWFYKYNPVRGNDELVLLLENIALTDDRQEKFSIGKLEIRASTFIRKEDGYHFLYRKDTVTTVSSRTTPYLAQSLSKKLTLTFTELMKKSYEAKQWDFAVSENELPDYSTVLKNKLEILKTDELKEGVYKDYYSFFTHNPEPGFTIETDKKGVVTKAVNGDKKEPIRNFYAFVHNGVPFKVIPVGYVEIFRDEQGLFIEAKKEELYPESSSPMIMLGGGVAGIIGSVVANVAITAIDAKAAKKRSALAGSEVILDPMTGNYILPEGFMKK